MTKEKKDIRIGDLLGSGSPSPTVKSTPGEGTVNIDPGDFPLLTEILEKSPGGFKEEMDQLSAWAREAAQRPALAQALRLVQAVLSEMYRHKV